MVLPGKVFLQVKMRSSFLARAHRAVTGLKTKKKSQTGSPRPADDMPALCWHEKFIPLSASAGTSIYKVLGNKSEEQRNLSSFEC